MTKIIQNFSSKKHIKALPVFDILLWSAGLLNFKKLGYKTKLYCEKSDIPFLKRWGLYDLYDEIDSRYLTKLEEDERFKQIDGNWFWSVRKLFCIEHEYSLKSKDKFMYFDTDILLYDHIELPNWANLFVWSIEEEPIYIPWEFMSVPEGYKKPEEFDDDMIAYNCGILAFSDKEKFEQYFAEYLKFTQGNPCILLQGANASEKTVKNIWACNAEQRILLNVSRIGNWKTIVFANPEQETGVMGFYKGGKHYYLLRAILRDFTDETQESFRSFWLDMYNENIKECLEVLEKENPTQLEIFLEIPWIKNLYKYNFKVKEYK